MDILNLAHADRGKSEAILTAVQVLYYKISAPQVIFSVMIELFGRVVMH